MKNKIKLTDAKIRAFTTPEKRREVYDEVVTGLILRITKTGYKSFAYRYWYHGKSKQITIGKYGDVSLAGARKIARDHKAAIHTGKDPLTEKQANREAQDVMPFRELSEIYDGIHLPTLRKSTQDYHKWAISTKVLPAIGKKDVKSISQKDIVRLLDKIAIADDAQATANKVRSRLHHMFEFAKGRGYVKKNPVSDTKPYEGGNNQRDRYYSADEIQQIWQAIEQLNEPVRSYMKIITLAGQRRTETHQMKWENIRYERDTDFEGWIWEIPKDLAKSGREHIVPLSRSAIEIIQDLKDRAGENPFVFASTVKDDIPIGLKTIKRAVKTIKEEGVSDFRPHDMRRTVATWLAKLGTPAQVVSKVLNHKTGGGGSLVTRIYNRYEYLPERQKALNRWSVELQKIISGNNETNIHKIG